MPTRRSFSVSRRRASCGADLSVTTEANEREQVERCVMKALRVQSLSLTRTAVRLLTRIELHLLTLVFFFSVPHRIRSCSSVWLESNLSKSLVLLFTSPLARRSSQ